MTQTPIQLFTIGFTQKTAQQFFDTLTTSGIKRVIDTRLHNVSQLAGFAKQKDLAYFLQKLGGMDYHHCLDLAPTADLLESYKKKRLSWSDYATSFVDLMRQRKIETTIDPQWLDQSCLLCSEAQPHHCHRRLVAEYLQTTLQDCLDRPITIHHL